MRPLLIIRPEPGNTATCARATALGLKVVGTPLFQVRALDWRTPDPADFDALLLTSGNAIRHGGAGLSSLKALPVWAVGTATAEAARQAGFTVTREGSKGMEALLEGVAKLRLLHLAARESMPLTADWLHRVIVYASDAIDPGDGFAAVLSQAPIVLLHSVRAADHFARLCADRSAISLIAISDAVAQAAGSGWERVAIAAQNSDDAMLETARHWAKDS